MEKHSSSPMTQLDTLVTSDELQLLKIMLPYIPSGWRRMLAIYIKVCEFSNTLRLFQYAEPIPSKSLHSPEDLMQDFSIFLNPSDADSVQMLLQFMSMIKNGNSSFDPSFDFSSFASQESSSEMSAMTDLFDNILNERTEHNE